ncbi:MAG: Rrf2 family transcriptional regulator [Treponema sp.]|jgi:Rrf2 family iron-sulfur cluster assembly transcriptional regulator|nr:Rrf2 family transcriptional regulator [Treponema sp.]
MRITTRGRYALRASLALAKLGKDNDLVSIHSLSEAEQISSVFLEQIFFKLKKAGIVQSVRGPGGGFSFARPLDSLTVKDILYAAGEELEAGPCDKHFEECQRATSCVSHKVWTTVSELVKNYLGSLTLASLLENAEDEEVQVKHEAS